MSTKLNSLLPQLKRPPIREAVCDVLRSSLLAGVFSPGEALSEPELASQLKVSRGPVREALLVLAEEGMVTHIPNRGFFVLQLTHGDVELIDKVRFPLEVLALSEARKRANSEKIAELQYIRDKMLESFRAKDMNTWTMLDQAFHTKIWELGGNPWLVSALRRIMSPYFVFSMAYKVSAPDLTYDLMRERHDLYVDYLKGATAKSADECVRFHLGEKS